MRTCPLISIDNLPQLKENQQTQLILFNTDHTLYLSCRTSIREHFDVFKFRYHHRHTFTRTSRRMYAPPTFTTPHQTTPQGSSAENNNLFINPVAAVDPQFVSDTNNQLYYLGQEQAITWSTNYTKYNIFLWQEALDGSKAAPSPVVLVGESSVNSLS